MKSYGIKAIRNRLPAREVLPRSPPAQLSPGLAQLFPSRNRATQRRRKLKRIVRTNVLHVGNAVHGSSLPATGFGPEQCGSRVSNGHDST